MTDRKPTDAECNESAERLRAVAQDLEKREPGSVAARLAALEAQVFVLQLGHLRTTRTIELLATVVHDLSRKP